MILLSPSQMAELLNAEVILPHSMSLPEALSSVVIDSRQVQAGSLFIALKGEQVDGHIFLQKAKDQGAVMALVEAKQAVDMPQLVVPSCLDALTELAKASRQAFTGDMVAITGSSGKTSTKEMLVSVLSQWAPVSATQGNQNNEIGLPLTLLNIQADSQYAVIEMGARRQGDIAALMHLAKPNVGVITNIGVAHIGVFGSREGIFEAKTELFTELNHSGKAIINLDDDYAEGLLEKSAHLSEQTTFSVKKKDADIALSNLILKEDGSDLTLHINQETVDISLSEPGLHTVTNALCVTACVRALGLMDTKRIMKGLSSTYTLKGRSHHYQGYWGGTLIDDTYNANPLSVKAAIDTLKLFDGETLLVLGDMKELGHASAEYHEEVLVYAVDAGIHTIFVLGDEMNAAAKKVNADIEGFSSRESLLASLRQHLSASQTILLKGSRSLALDKLIDPLLQKEGSPCC